MSRKAVNIPGMKVSFVPVGRMKEPNPHKFKKILESLLTKKGEKAVQIECESFEEARGMQRGFHSSGASRRLKREGWKIITTRPSDKIVQVRLERAAA